MSEGSLPEESMIVEHGRGDTRFQPTLVNVLALIGATLTTTVSSVLLKLAGDSLMISVEAYLWYFIPAIVVSTLFPFCITVALRDNNANVIYGIYGAFASILFPVFAWIFDAPLTWWQYVGIGLAVVGMILLRQGKTTETAKGDK